MARWVCSASTVTTLPVRSSPATSGASSLISLPLSPDLAPGEHDRVVVGDRREQVRAGTAAGGGAADALAVDGHPGQAPGAVGGDLVPDLTALHATVVMGARPGGPRCGLGPPGGQPLQVGGVDLGQDAAQGRLAGCGDHTGQRVGGSPQREQHPPRCGRGPLGLGDHLVVSSTRRRGDDHGQQEPQLVAQPLPRPMINNLVQVLDQRTAIGTNSTDAARDISVDLPGGVGGDRLASNRRGEAG